MRDHRPFEAARTLGCLLLALGLTCSSGPAGADAGGDVPADIQDLIDRGQYAAAAQAARERLAKVEADHGADTLETANVLDLLATASWRGGKARETEALDAAERAVRIKEQKLGPSAPGFARSLQIQGHVLLARGEIVPARGLFERALAVFEAALGPENLDVAGALNSMAIVLRHTGDYAAARPFIERSLRIRETLAPDSRDLAQACNTLAAILWNLGDYEGSRAQLERALPILEKTVGPEHPRVASLRNNLGTLLRDMGELTLARSHLERAVAIQESLDPDDPELALSLGNLASVCSDLGDLGRSVELGQRALSIQEKALGPEHPEVAATLSNLAEGYLRLLIPEQARPLLERSLAIRLKVLGPEHPDIAWTSENLARLYQRLGMLAEAKPLYEQSLAIREKTLGPEHPSLAWSLDGLGWMYAQQGDAPAAIPFYERALAIRLKALGPAHPLTAEVSADLALTRFQAGDRRAALEGALEAERAAREHLRSTARTISERDALCYEDRRSSGLGLALSVVARGEGREATARVWDEVVRSRALVMDLVAARHRAVLQQRSPELSPLVEALDAARARLARLVVKGPDPDEPRAYRESLRQAQAERDKAEQALASASAPFQSELSRSTAGLAEVVGSLPDRDTALVAYIRYNRHEPPPDDERGLTRFQPAYLALVLPQKDAQPVLLDLGKGAWIDELVRRWRNEVSRPPEDLASVTDYQKAGDALRRAIWDPLAPHLRGNRQVFIVPDGALQLVSFAALPTRSDRFLIETGPRIHYLSTERDLIEAGGAPSNGRGLLLLGGPDFDALPGASRDQARARARGQTISDSAVSSSPPPATYRGERSDCASFRSLRFEALPSALAEADEVESLWAGQPGRGTTLKLTGPEAREEEFKARAAGHSVLHLATHGFFVADTCASWQAEADPYSCRSSAIAGTLPAGESPLLLSGLALAGANRRDSAAPRADVDDGILTSEEIASLDLRGVDWAVLSGCDTGLGPLRPGEGVFGLRRTFRVAGVRTLVMSLWSVEDHAAREWIRSLYSERLRGQSTVDSVHRATLRSLEAYRRAGASTHPFYWAGFVAVGGWR